MDLKFDSSGRGWMHIDPGQYKSGSMLTTSVDVGRIQKVRWKGPRAPVQIGHPDLSNMTYLSRLTMMFLSCFSRFLRERSRLGLRSGLGLGIGLVLGDRVRVKSEVRIRSILFICTTENSDRQQTMRYH